MNKDFTIGIDVGGTNVKAAKVRHKSLLSEVLEYRTPDNLDSFNELIRTIVKSLSSEDVETHVGLSIPGDVDYFKQSIYLCPNLPWLTEGGISNIMEMRNVFIANDADAALFGEIVINDYSDRSLALITLGTGIGSSYCVAGISTWDANLSSELGHTKVASQNRQCHCGNYDCLEAYFSGWSLLKTAYDKGLKIENIEVLFGLADNNPTAKDIIYSSVGYLAVGIANLVNTTGITTIILSGKISKSFDLFSDVLIQKTKDILHSSFKDRLVITKSNYIDKAAIIGAANFQINSKKFN